MRRAVPILVAWLLLLPASAWSEVFWDPSGIGQIVIEAEHYTTKSLEWTEVTEVPEASGGSYMLANGGGPAFCGDPTCAPTAPVLSYTVDFPEAGTWQVWLRGYAADRKRDSAHTGLNGTATTESANVDFEHGAWGWTQTTMTPGPTVIRVPSAGMHTFDVWRREIGLQLDKIVLVKPDASLLLEDPTGTGPSETPDAVPATFSRVELDDLGGGNMDVTVWGRLYEFRGGPIPTSIYTQGRRLLKNGDNGIPQVRRAGGSWTTVSWSRFTVEQVREQRVVLEGVGTAGPNLEVTCKTTIEYDGMLRFDIALRAVGASVTIADVVYSHTVDGGSTQHFSHHVPYDYSTGYFDKEELASSAGPFPSDVWVAYTPTLFAGDRRIGLEWWFPANARWDTVSLPIRLTKTADASVQAFPVKEASLVLGAGEVWRDTFAIFPLPLRAADADRRARRFGPAATFASSNLDLDPSLYTLYQITDRSGHFIPEDMGFPQAKREAGGALNDETADMLAWLASKGPTYKYIPYGFLMLAPYHAVAERNRLRWRANGVLTDRFGLHPSLPETYYPCTGRADYFAWHREHTVAALRAQVSDEPIAGLYFDHGSISQVCAESAVLAGAPAGAQVWEYFVLRDYYKRLYESLRREGLDAIVTSHQYGSPKALAAFIDVVFVGEALNSVFCEGGPLGQEPKCPGGYDPDYFDLPAHYLDATLYPIVGGTTALLPQVRHCSSSRWVGPVAPCSHRQRELHSLTLSNDYPVWWGASYADPGSTFPLNETTGGIYQAADKVGSLANTVFYGWWEVGTKAVVDAPGADVRASVYANPVTNKALVVVTNYGATSATQVDVALDLGALGLPTRNMRYRNPELSEEVWSPVQAGEASADAEIPPKGFQMILVAP